MDRLKDRVIFAGLGAALVVIGIGAYAAWPQRPVERQGFFIPAGTKAASTPDLEPVKDSLGFTEFGKAIKNKKAD